MKTSNILFFLFFCLAISCCFLACNSSVTGVHYKQNVIQIKGEFLPIDHFVGNPYTIICIDTLLIYDDRFDNKLISIYDVKSNHFVGRYVSEGNGPGEAIAPFDILPYSQNNRLYAYQRNKAMLSIFDVPELKMCNTLSFTSTSTSSAWRPFKVEKMKDYYLGETVFDKGRFGLYSLQGEFLRSGVTYPFDGEDVDRTAAFMLYQGNFCANPEANQLALGCVFCDHLSFYEVNEEKEFALLKEYTSNTIKARYPGQLVIQGDCTINYTWAQGTSAYCYMLFSGKTYSENNEATGGGHYIIVFDWQGNYVKTFETDYEIGTFYVDEINNQVYATALNSDGEYEIMLFKL